MTTITAKMIAHSVARPDDGRPPVATMQLRYPKFIHGEFLTHRVLSRNSSSSRAIPVERLIMDIVRDPVFPAYWGSNKPGMQAGEEIRNQVEVMRKGALTLMPRDAAWLEAMHSAISAARAFNKAGYHKQIINRLIEPFSHINTLVTGTDWDNFFELRCHKDAQPEMQVLANAMFKCLKESNPKVLQHGEWHLPYIQENELGQDPVNLIRASVARCARVSYFTHEDKTPVLNQDLDLYDKLITSTPIHASPAEHQCTPSSHTYQQANLKGWMQWRRVIELEADETAHRDPLRNNPVVGFISEAQAESILEEMKQA